MSDNKHNPTDPPPGNPRGGPRTPEGKARSARNALKHGFTGRHNFIPEGMQEDFDLLVEGLKTELAPLGAIEGEKFDLLLNFRWCLRLIQICKEDLFTRGNPFFDPELRPALELLLRYERHNYNLYRQTFADVCARQNQRLALQGLAHTLTTKEHPLPATADTRYLHGATVQAQAVNPDFLWSPPRRPSPSGANRRAAG